jgi:S-adenosylhomocysteine hydrolase
MEAEIKIRKLPKLMEEALLHQALEELKLRIEKLEKAQKISYEVWKAEITI